jgi:hypothetical protein
MTKCSCKNKRCSQIVVKKGDVCNMCDAYCCQECKTLLVCCKHYDKDM